MRFLGNRFVSVMNKRNKNIFFWLLFITGFVNAQTQLINPSAEGGFELGASLGANGWTVVQASTNTWRASAVPGSFAGNNAAFISATAGVDYVYTTGIYQTSHFYRDVTVPAGENLITLSFQYKNPGENLFDRLLVYTAPTSVFPNANEPLSNLTAIVDATLVFTDPANINAYTSVNLELPQSLAGTTFRLIFTWQNDNVDGSGIPAAIDNISLTSQTSPFGQPLNGFYTINNLMPTSSAIPIPGSNFNNFLDAISYLNDFGIAGDVRFDVASGQTFNHSPLTITRSGTATDTIGFIRSGSGANPLIFSSGGSTSTDAAITLNGVDYITIDGIDISTEPNPVTSAVNIEYAIRVNNASATNGSQFNKIRNVSITHNQLFTQNIAVLQISTSPSSLAGTNSNNTYENITINSALNGFRINSNSINRDEFVTIKNCLIGTSGPNSLGGTGSGFGIFFNQAKDVTIKGNIIANFSSSGGSSSALDGIYVSNATGLVTISGNQVRALRNILASSLCVVSGIRCVVASGGSANVFNNFVSDLTTAYSTTTSSILLKGLSIQPLTAVSTSSTINVDFNNVSLDGSTCPNVSNVCLEIIQPGPIVNVRNNVFANFTSGQSGSPFHYAMVVPNLTIAAVGSLSNHNDLYLSDATNGVTVRKTSGTPENYLSLPTWNTASGLDGQSISANPEFTNIQSDLHVLSTALDGTGSMSGITWVIDDIDGQLRDATPDIGADEFSLIENDLSFIAFLSPEFDDCFSSVEEPTIRIRNLAYIPHDFILKPLNIQLTVTGPIPATINITISDNALNANQPLGSLAFLDIPVGLIDMSSYGNYTINCTLSVMNDENSTNDVAIPLNLENSAPEILPIAVPFTTFNGINLSSSYAGWNESNSTQPITGTSEWTVSIGLGGAGNRSASFNYNAGNAAGYIISPKITAAFNTFVKFDLALTESSAIIGNGAFDADDVFALLVSTDCGFTFTEVLAFQLGDIIGNQLTNFEYFLGAYEGSDIILAFKADDGTVSGTPFNLHLDNINIVNSTQEKVDLLAMVTPVQSSCFSASEQISLRIKNNGFVPIDFSVSPLSLTVDISGGNSFLINDVITNGILAIGDSTVFVVPGTVDLSIPDAYQFNISANLTTSFGVYQDSLVEWLYGQNPSVSLVYEDTACLLSTVNINLLNPVNGVTNTVLPKFEYTSLPVALPDNVGIDIPLEVTGAGGYAAQLLTVTIDSIVHGNITQLKIELIAPDNSSILLTEGNLGSGPGFYSTSFSMNSTELIQNQTPPFTGVFIPAQPFSLLTGSANGTWKLRVTDEAIGTIGILHKWSLTLLEQNTVANFSWTSSNTIQSSSLLEATVLVENSSYIVYTITDVMGCTKTDSAQITFPEFIDNPVVNDVLCFGNANGSIISSITGGFGVLDYDWSSGDTDATADQLTAGNYTLDVTDSYGCTAQFTYGITEPATGLTASIAGTDVLCFGSATGAANLTVIGGTGSYTYSWSNSASTEDLTGLVAGTYTVTITDAEGCTTTASVTITEPNALVADATATNITCMGCLSTVTVSATGGTPPYIGDGVFTESSGGTYAYTVEDANGCTFTANVEVLNVTGLSEATISKAAVYPNPFIDEFRLKVHTNSLLEVRLFDTQSKEQDMKMTLTYDEFIITTSGLSTGVYLLKVTYTNFDSEMLLLIKK